MITFKQFIAEIDHDDTVFTKRASDRVANFKIFKMDDHWKPLFSIDDYDCVWKSDVMDFKVALVGADGEAAFVLVLQPKTVKVPGGTIKGVVTSSLSSRDEHRGKNLGFKIYEALIKHGQVLFSSNQQTTGSRKLWEQLVSANTGQTFVLASESAARWYIRKAGEEYATMHVLLKGSQERMTEEAYASSETRWVVLPHGLADAGGLEEHAIDLSTLS